MNWIIFFIISILVFAAGIISAVYIYRKKIYKSRRTVFYCVFAGTVLSGTLLFIPIYWNRFGGESLGVFKTILIALHNTIRLFIVDGEYDIVTEYIHNSDGWVYPAFTTFAAVLYVFAPFLTFSAVISLFRSLGAQRRLLLSFHRDLYVFSELNERSILLAEDLKKSDKKRQIIFTDVYMEDTEASDDLIDRARAISAICFKSDIRVVNYRRHDNNKKIYFLIIGSDETENIEQTDFLVKNYKDIPNTYLYYFLNSSVSGLMLSSIDKGKMKVRTVNEARSLIYRVLFEQGQRILESNDVNAVIVGLGKYGEIMARSLPWVCQMPGFTFKMHIFDQEINAFDKMSIKCPDLLNPQYNGVTVPGEAQYDIEVFPGISVETMEFTEKIQEIKDATYVFVDLGSDEANFNAATYIRMLYERNGIKPLIQTIVRNPAGSELLKKLKNFKGQDYEIDFIGDLNTSYSERVVFNSDVEREALKDHLLYNDEDSFWASEYNYNSSVALSIALKLRRDCHIPGADKPKQERTENESEQLKMAEHCRWNAYMRSEGYIYSGSRDKSSRNDLGKMHPDLVNYYDLTDEDRKKDNR